ncbi:unnamed protein product [Discula destructiva]
MDHQAVQTPVIEYDENAVMDISDGGPDVDIALRPSRRLSERTPARKTRSMSDGGSTPLRLTSLHQADTRRTSKDDSNITTSVRDAVSSSNSKSAAGPPVTPHRSVFPLGLSLQLPPQQASTSPAQQSAASYSKAAPLSPKLDHSQTYSSPTNILPRRSRGLDFSRAATSLHHTTLANQASPDSSPTIGGRGINIPGRRPGDFGAPEQTSNSLWSVMGNHDRHHIAASLGSAANLVSDSSSSSDEDDMMEDTDELYCTTPQVTRTSLPGHQSGSGFSAAGGSPAANSLLSFQQRQRPRKQLKKKPRGTLGMGFPPASGCPSIMSKSPPTTMSSYGNIAKEIATPHARRESISWAANQLHISGSESEGSPKPGVDMDSMRGPVTDGQNRVVRRTVTRRSNLLPKSRNFSRVKMALAEEGTPIESEFRREAEVVRQVRDVDPEPPRPTQPMNIAQSSPSMPAQDSVEELSEDAMIVDNAPGLSSSFKQQAQKNSKGRMFWETFSETSSVGGARTTPPPPVPHRGSSSGMDDMAMDSPSTTSGPSGLNGFIFPMTTTTSSSENHTPQPSGACSLPPSTEHAPPSAAEIARRFNMGKRRRDDDLDLDSGNFKRRAVSPGMSVHNSPIMQSPMQYAPWGSRPGSGDKGSGSGTGTPSENGEKRPSITHKGRVGFQGMIDTNDGITRLSIE